jgi:lysozyme
MGAIGSAADMGSSHEGRTKVNAELDDSDPEPEHSANSKEVYAMDPKALEIAGKIIAEDEGRVDRIYLDTVGKWTGGIGHNFSDNKLSDAVIALLFKEDLADAEREVRHVYGDVIEDIDPVRLAVLLDLSFNLSEQRLEGFHNFVAAVKAEYWEKAAQELKYKDSAKIEMGFTSWWTQVGRRGPKLQRLLRTGIV